MYLKSRCLYLRGNVSVAMRGVFWDILEEKLEVEDVDCVTKHMDSDVTCLNPLLLAISYVAFMQFMGIVGRARAIPINK